MKHPITLSWLGLITSMAMGLLIFGCNKQPVKVLPIRTVIDKHAITPGYAVHVINQGNAPMRWTVTVTRSGNVSRSTPVVDNGRSWDIRGLVDGDTIQVEADGYQSQIIPIQ